MSRVPNRCWIRQGDLPMWHRENRVLSPRQSHALGGDLGETYCRLALRADRVRKRHKPDGEKVCVECLQGARDEYRFGV